MRKRFATPLVATLTLCASHAALAIPQVYCVGTAEALTAAVEAIDRDQEGGAIRVRVGTYVVPEDGWRIVMNTPRTLTFEGGYLDESCLQRTFDASRTVLDGGGRTRILTIDMRQEGDPAIASHLWVWSFTFRNGRATEAGALKIGDPVGPRFPGQVIIEGNVFVDNVATAPSSTMPEVGPGAVLAVADGFSWGDAFLVNANVFARNTGTNAAAMYLQGDGRIEVAGNTFVANRSTDVAATSRSALRLDARGVTDAEAAFVSNNLFWHNNPDARADTFDLRYDGIVDLSHNAFGTAQGTPASQVETFNVDPQFRDEAGGDYRLSASSPLIDRGLRRAHGFHDVAGAERLQGLGIDIGAYEGGPDTLFTSGFE